jgi:general secretion pathway protein G
MTKSRTHGFTLVELIVTVALVTILVGLALPLATNTVKREKEMELRADLRTMREAIDRYKTAADQGQVMADAMANGYPPDLETLANGVDLTSAVGKKIFFLRAVPIDPMSECYCNTDWDLRSDQDDPASGSWGGQDVFDVHTKSNGTALDGTKYKDW